MNNAFADAEACAWIAVLEQAFKLLFTVIHKESVK